MKNTNTNYTPQEIAARHKAHQEMLEWHKWAKAEMRTRHRNGWFRRKVIPLHLV